MPSAESGTAISLTATARDSISSYDHYSSLELFEYANEFSAKLDTSAGAIVDVSKERLDFTTGVSDRIAIDFIEAPITNGMLLTDADKLRIVLSGDMAGIDRFLQRLTRSHEARPRSAWLQELQLLSSVQVTFRVEHQLSST